ncbi:hypothetical protein BN1080_00333 [Planococcus massiliensis]|uniref:Uncharacterized protein n=1 Tax=Planococcus massiliensis TaxID=1499687 RepID=A0A098EGL0_9BACL|nr:hypothetical protein [Planococcus massiliensis]CEG21423.1 hypothetical protein BN1080_00333 [Planococcus massiliensis]
MNSTIHLLAPSTLALDHYYKVYPTKSSLVFAKVGGQFYDKASDDNLPLVVGLAFMAFRKHILTKRIEKREAAVDRQMSENPQSLLAKKNNFEFHSTAIRKAEMKTKSTFHTAGTATGTLRFYLNDGSEKKFTIPSFVPTEKIVEFFEEQQIQLDLITQ